MPQLFSKPINFSKSIDKTHHIVSFQDEISELEKSQSYCDFESKNQLGKLPLGLINAQGNNTGLPRKPQKNETNHIKILSILSESKQESHEMNPIDLAEPVYGGLGSVLTGQSIQTWRQGGSDSNLQLSHLKD